MRSWLDLQGVRTEPDGVAASGLTGPPMTFRIKHWTVPLGATSLWGWVDRRTGHGTEQVDGECVALGSRREPALMLLRALPTWRAPEVLRDLDQWPQELWGLTECKWAEQSLEGRARTDATPDSALVWFCDGNRAMGLRQRGMGQEKDDSFGTGCWKEQGRVNNGMGKGSPGR